MSVLLEQGHSQSAVARLLDVSEGTVSYRYGRGAMIITTNKSIRDWTELLAGDEVLATAILDRLLHRSHVLNIKGRSYRLRDLEDALKS